MQKKQPSHLTSANSRLTIPITRRQFLQVGAGGLGMLGLATVLAGCQPVAPGAAPAAQPAAASGKGGKLRVGYDQDIVKLDPGVQQTGVDWTPASLIYGRLVEYDNTMMQVVPNLAESWKVSEDGLTFTFQIRKGVKFHTGRELKAADIAYTFDRGIEIGPKGRFKGYTLAMDQYKATGDYEFVIRLKQPDVTFFPNLAVMAASIVDKETIDQIDTKPIGTGPYTLVEWVPGEHALYRKFADYWDQTKLAGWPDEIETVPIPEAQTRIANLKSGDVDIATNIPAEFNQEIKDTSGLQLLTQEVTASYLCTIFNLQRPPFKDNKLLRQAIARAIDTETIHKNIFFGSGEVGCNLLPSSHWAYTDINCYKRNLDEARKLLKDSGVGDGLTIKMRTFTTPEFGVSVAEIIQKNLAEIGLKVEIEPLEWSFYVEDAWVKKNFEMTLAWYTREPDPDGLFSSVLRKDQGNNPMGYVNDTIEGLFDKGKATADQAQRKQIYEEIMKIAALDDTPLVKLQTMDIAWAANNKVGDFGLLAKGYPNWYNWKWQGS